MDLVLRHFVFICGYTFDMSKTPTSVGNIMLIVHYILEAITGFEPSITWS